MDNIVVFLIVIAVWFLINGVILPRLGVPT